MVGNLSTLEKADGSVRKRARKGRGLASGAGKTCGLGMRGQKCRSGYSKKPWREGGQTPLYRRLPKRQVNTRLNRKEYTVINLDEIQALADQGFEEVSLLVLEEAGLVKKVKPYGLKVLAAGKLEKAITVKASKFSEAAKSAIESSGGKAVEI